MNNLLNFFAKHSAWLVFTLYAVLSCVLLFRNNPYQQSVYLTSANSATSAVYGMLYTVSSYFHLKDINEELMKHNGELEMEVIALKEQLGAIALQTHDITLDPSLSRFHFVQAHVISNSVVQPYNYITIDRGTASGIRPEMGVVDQNGVVGIVNAVGPHSARIISLLNPNMKLSCKLKNGDYFGALVWDGKSPQYAVLEELPKHIKYTKGDTVLTSGYSAVFPEGLMVGIVEGSARGDKESFANLKVRLSANFSQLNTVHVISNDMADELKRLQATDDNATNRAIRPNEAEVAKQRQNNQQQ